MNDVEELKRFVTVHAGAQNVPAAHYGPVLERITTDEGQGPGSWVGEWTAAGRQLESQGRPLDAARDFNLARFPFVDGPGRAQAHAACLAAFEAWRAGGPIEPVEFDVHGGRVRGWAAGLSTARPLPLLLVMPGIVAVKEQWAPMLPRLRRLGLAGLALELPGVGENPLTYTADSHTMISQILDQLGDRALVDRTVAIALSFSGHLVINAALNDRRIRGLVTSGAPVHAFFTDRTWQPRVPAVTTDTLAHLTGVPADRLWDELRGWALQPTDLAALTIPIHYAASTRDEIIPPGELAHLEANVRHLHVVRYADVHGAPQHISESRLWTMRAALQMAGGGLPHRAAVGSALQVLRIRRRLIGARA